MTTDPRRAPTVIALALRDGWLVADPSTVPPGTSEVQFKARAGDRVESIDRQRGEPWRVHRSRVPAWATSVRATAKSGVAVGDPPDDQGRGKVLRNSDDVPWPMAGDDAGDGDGRVERPPFHPAPQPEVPTYPGLVAHASVVGDLRERLAAAAAALLAESAAWPVTRFHSGGISGAVPCVDGLTIERRRFDLGPSDVVVLGHASRRDVTLRRVGLDGGSGLVVLSHVDGLTLEDCLDSAPSVARERYLSYVGPGSRDVTYRRVYATEDSRWESCVRHMGVDGLRAFDCIFREDDRGQARDHFNSPADLAGHAYSGCWFAGGGNVTAGPLAAGEGGERIGYYRGADGGYVWAPKDGDVDRRRAVLKRTMAGVRYEGCAVDGGFTFTPGLIRPELVAVDVRSAGHRVFDLKPTDYPLPPFARDGDPRRKRVRPVIRGLTVTYRAGYLRGRTPTIADLFAGGKGPPEGWEMSDVWIDGRRVA